jgi:type II secretory pathway predicted ATPase ExeA
MFLDFYKLKEQPFGVTPDPHYLYLSASHREALASLFYGAKTGRGLLALIAPPGMGKTTLLYRLLEHLRGSARTAFLFQTQCDSCGLLRYLLGDLGIETRGQDFVTMHEQLNELLLREASTGRRIVLVIDEAQNLDDSVLEAARLLTDFETTNQKLLQIVFAGQSQLAEKLQRPELAQLRQRISILGRLEPFGPAEVIHYIDHRLRVAGYNAGPLFTPAAFERIAANSKGIPRNINNLCFSALSMGCALGRKQINTDLIREVEADLDLSSLVEQRPEVLPVVLPVPADPRPPAAEVRICRGADRGDATSRLPIFHAAEGQHTIGRMAVVASVFVLALFVGLFYRQDLEAAAARTRGTLSLAAASLTSHLGAPKAKLDAPPATTQQGPKETGSELSDPGAVVTTGVPATTTSVVAAFAGVPLTRAREPEGQVTITPNVNVKDLTQFINGTTTVIVQPRDDLRQICLRHLGRYNAEILREIRNLNPELSDPDRITVGQRIILPASAPVRTNASRSSSVPGR